jgi:hypothetical protein
LLSKSNQFRFYTRTICRDLRSLRPNIIFCMNLRPPRPMCYMPVTHAHSNISFVLHCCVMIKCFQVFVCEYKRIHAIFFTFRLLLKAHQVPRLLLLCQRGSGKWVQIWRMSVWYSVEEMLISITYLGKTCPKTVNMSLAK